MRRWTWQKKTLVHRKDTLLLRRQERVRLEVHLRIQLGHIQELQVRVSPTPVPPRQHHSWDKVSRLPQTPKEYRRYKHRISLAYGEYRRQADI